MPFQATSKFKSRLLLARCASAGLIRLAARVGWLPRSRLRNHRPSARDQISDTTVACLSHLAMAPSRIPSATTASFGSHSDFAVGRYPSQSSGCTLQPSSIERSTHTMGRRNRYLGFAIVPVSAATAGSHVVLTNPTLQVLTRPCVPPADGPPIVPFVRRG